MKDCRRNLYQAVEEFRKDDFVRQVLGKHISDEYAQLKLKEWQDYEERLPTGKSSSIYIKFKSKEGLLWRIS